MMQQYLRWSCSFNYGIVMPTLKWFLLLMVELITQPSENCCVAEKVANSSKVTPVNTVFRLYL